ncbi:unnamed protein product [Aphanomyces euteiches]
MTKQVFVFSVLREMLPNFPTLVGDRLFATINIDGTGFLKYKEFIGFVALIKKGTSREQLKLVFRMVDSTETGYVSRKDMRIMLAWVMQANDVAAIASDESTWTPATLESKLFVKNEKLKLDTFRSRMAGLPCKQNALVMWIDALAEAMAFEEHLSLPNTPASISGASRIPLSTAPSAIESAGLRRGISLTPEQLKTFEQEFHQLRDKFNHEAIPKDVIRDAFSPIFPSFILDAVAPPSSTPALRDWIQRLAFAAHPSMLEGLHCLFDLFSSCMTASDLEEMLYFLLPRPAYLIHPDLVIDSSPLPETIALWSDQLVAFCDKTLPAKITFDELCGWLATEQTALLHSIHQLCESVHIHLVVDRPPSVSIQYRLIDAMLSVYSTEAPGSPGQEWLGVDAAWWNRFLAQGVTHNLPLYTESNVPVAKDSPIGAITNGSEHTLWVNRSVWDALCLWYPPAPSARVRVTDAQQALELDPLQIIVQIDEESSPETKAITMVVSRRTPVTIVPALIAAATEGATHPPLSYRCSNETWVPWPTAAGLSTSCVGDLKLVASVDMRFATRKSSSVAANETGQPHVVGLSNLGNSCYMNAVLQCLFHTTLLQDFFTSDEYLYDVNVTNAFGMQGVFAAVYAELAKAMASQRSRPIAPLTFKLAIGKLYPLFQGHMQHDGHEFLSVLLNGLSEDLCRPLQNYALGPSKPYVDLADSNGRADAQVAKEWWTAHVLRDPSIITALFTGQFKSALACPQCGQTSNRFEPFSFLQVPLPQEPLRWLTVYLHATIANSSGKCRGIQKLKLRIATTAGAADLCAAVKEAVPHVAEGTLVAVTVHGHRVHSMIQPKQMLVDITHEIHVVHFSDSDTKDNNPKQWWQCVFRRQRMVPFYFLQPFRVQLFSVPFLVPSQPFNGHALYTWVSEHHHPLASTGLKDKDKSIYFALPAGLPTSSSWPFTLRYVRAADGSACSRCPFTARCIGCPVSTSEDERIVMKPSEMLALDWSLDSNAVVPAEIVPHASYVQFHATPPPAHSLEECIAMLCSNESVDMYCSKCKESVLHTKRLALWSAPPILIVQLKRFQAVSDVHSIKAENAIRFPTSLNVNPFIAGSNPPNQNPCESVQAPTPTKFEWKDGVSVEFPFPTAVCNPEGYSLYGIVCHFGVLGAGHYVAYVQDQTTRWWCVDDMTATIETDLNVAKLMQSAYLLFYQRDDMREVSMEKWFPRQTDGSISVNIDELRKQVHTWQKPGHARTKSKYWLNWSWR